MNRVILTPAALPSSALAELRQWLGITTGNDDNALSALIAAALETCEAFIGAMPLEAACEERLDGRCGWLTLATRPVQSIAAVDAIASNGSRSTLLASEWEADLGADGTGRVRLARPSTRIAVRFTAGLASEWGALPDGLRHGIVRLAAHQHREREGSGVSATPPASVAALWRPWRRLRLA